jgi:DNA mismatch repair protein MSH5
VEQHRTVVLPGVSDELDTIRHRYDGLDSLLSEVAKKITETIPFDVDIELNVIYFPQIGFLTVIPLDESTGRGVHEGELDPENAWVRMFSTEAKVYYKSNEMREMDDQLGDVYGMICGKFPYESTLWTWNNPFADKEIEIIYSLAQRVLYYKDLITTCSDLCGELDRLFT